MSDSSVAPGDSPTKEEMGSACRFQPRQGQDPAEAPPQATGVQGQSRRMGTFSLYSCPKFCRNSAGRMPHSCPAISPQCETGSGRTKGGQKQAGALPHTVTREAGHPLQLNSCSYPCFPWEQVLEDSSTFWTVFLVAFSRSRAGSVCFMRKLVQYISSLLHTPVRQHYRIFLINAFVLVKEAK